MRFLCLSTPIFRELNAVEPGILVAVDPSLIWAYNFFTLNLNFSETDIIV